MKRFIISLVVLLLAFLAYKYLNLDTVKDKELNDKPDIDNTEVVAPPAKEDPSAKFLSYKPQGIDISYHQENLHWKIIKRDNIGFVYTKATEGITYTDPNFASNWKKAKETGLLRGAYHFYRTNDAPEAQANNFLHAVGKLGKYDLPAVLDIENAGVVGRLDKTKLNQDLLTWLQLVEEGTGKKPLLYTGYNFGKDYLTDGKLADYDLWIAEYGKESPSIPPIWKEKGWRFWQKSDTKLLKDESDTLDYDIFNGTMDELVNYVSRESMSK